MCVCWGWDRHLSPHQQAILQISARSYNSTQFWHSLPGEMAWDSIGSRLNPTRSPPAPPKEGKPWEALVKFRVQEHQFTGRPRPNHRTLECHSSQNLPLPHERPLYQGPFYTVCHICLLTPGESKHDDGAKKGSTRGTGWFKEEGGQGDRTLQKRWLQLKDNNKQRNELKCLVVKPGLWVSIVSAGQILLSVQL